jgi:hypothetical protein
MKNLILIEGQALRNAILIDLYKSENHTALCKDVQDRLTTIFAKDLTEHDLTPYINKSKKKTSKWIVKIIGARNKCLEEGYILTVAQHKRGEWKLSETGIIAARKIFIETFGYDYWDNKQSLNASDMSAIILQELGTEESVFIEGKEKYILHYMKERNPLLVKRKKELALKENSLLPCEICQFSFKEKYGETGEGFIEAHHIFPVSQLTEETETKLEDLILLCSNCHRMIHRKRPWVTSRADIKELLSKNA